MNRTAKKLACHFISDKPLNIGTSDVIVYPDGWTTFRIGWDIVIATKEQYDSGSFYVFSDCGYRTLAIYNRLNAIFSLLGIDPICKLDTRWYWQGKPFPLNTPITFVEGTHQTTPNFKN